MTSPSIGLGRDESSIVDQGQSLRVLDMGVPDFRCLSESGAMRRFTRMTNEATSSGSFLTGLLVGALVVVLAWGFASALEASSPASGSPDNATPGTHTSRTTSPGAHSDAEADCRRVFEAQAEPLRAAAATLAQWKVHVEAMNKLVAGKLTLSQANVFWNRTRIGAHRRLARYEHAVRSRSNIGASCARQNAPATETYLSCKMAVVARAAELRAAAVALGTWRHHVRDMDMLRMGMLSPARATRMWLAAWQKGEAQLNDYDDAVTSASVTHCE